MPILFEFFRRLKVPLLILLFCLALYFGWRLLNLPSQPEMIEMVRGYFLVYGLITVFLSALIEGLLLVGWYYPGGLVIFLGVIFAGPDWKRVALVIALATLGMIVSYTINYFLGRYGWYRLLLRFGLKDGIERAQKNLAKVGPRGIFMTYWQPNLASLSATAAGILRMPFRTFLIFSLLAAAIWNTFWGATVSLFGESTLSVLGIRFVLVAFTVWAIYEFVIMKKEKKQA